MMNIWSKKQGGSVRTTGLENECWFRLREMKLFQRAKKAYPFRVGGVNAASGSQGTERRFAQDPGGVA